MRACVRESEIVRALGADAWSSELRGHMQSCAACAETERVTRALLASTESLRRDLQIPDVDAVWRHAQTRAREAALRRAIRPLRVMLALSLVSLAAAGVWMAAQFQGTVAADFQALGGWGWLAGDVSVSATALTLLLALLMTGTASLWYVGRHTERAGRSVA